MCTLSVAASADGLGLRVMMNRDERRLRMAATPPAIVERDGMSAAWPVDQQGGGTWIAANEAGLVLALVNRSGGAAAERAAGAPSRGTVIPALVAAESLADVEERFLRRFRAPGVFAPFTLVAISREGTLALTPGAPACRGGRLWTSSSLGDARVEQPRRALFDHLLATSPDEWTAQDRLHQHAWPDRRELSVLMSRPDACTVSRTTVEIAGGRIDMRYAALVDGWPVGVAMRSMALRRPATEAAA